MSTDLYRATAVSLIATTYASKIEASFPTASLGPMGTVSRIAQLLRLPDTGQDWGVEHADASRLEEFVAFAEGLIPENTWEVEALAELILQSVEEAMDSAPLDPELRRRVVEFIRTRSSEFPIMLQRWCSYPPTEWHFVSLLREANGP